MISLFLFPLKLSMEQSLSQDKNHLIIIQLQKSFFPNPAIDCVCAIPTELRGESLCWPEATVLAKVQSNCLSAPRTSSAGPQREAAQTISPPTPLVPTDDGFLSPHHMFSLVWGLQEPQQSSSPRNGQAMAPSQQDLL